MEYIGDKNRGLTTGHYYGHSLDRKQAICLGWPSAYGQCSDYHKINLSGL